MNPNDRMRLLPFLLVPAVTALLIALFTWPQARLEPRDLPIGLAGPAAAAGPLSEQLSVSGDALDIKRYSSAGEARSAIEDRDVYGAFVASPRGVTLLTASAASPTVAALLLESAQAAGAGGGARQVGGLVGASVLAGLAVVAMTQGWLEVIEGSWIANTAVLGLLVLSISSLVAGLMSLMGPPGIGVAAVLVVLIGNPWSGVATAPELLPTPTGDIGQLLPPGAGGNALRSTAFFDGAGVAGHLLVLVAWAAVGLAAVAAASSRGKIGESAAA